MTNSKLQINSKIQMSKSKLWIFLNVCFLVLGIWSLAPAALAAVPTWTVGFDANTDFEKSLEGFLTRLMGQVSARQETFQQSYDLAKIMKGREDVNKLIFESFSELRNEPLLLEFQNIRKACEPTTNTTSVIDPGSIGSVGALAGSGSSSLSVSDLWDGNSVTCDLLDPGITVGSLKGQCLFYTQVQEYLRTRG